MIYKINEFKKKIIIQAGAVELMLELFIENLQNENEDRLKEIFLSEEKINVKEIEIEEDVIEMIALNHPGGKNLRTVLMILKMNNDLERIGDLIEDMTKLYLIASNKSKFVYLEKLTLMCKKSHEMLKESIESFKKEDSSIAKIVCEKDDIVDDFHKELRKDIIQYITMNPSETELMCNYLNITFKVERIADLATNIAEEAIYLSEGKDIKHGFLQNS
ncbi:MAG: phosphate signaling complex protein PhoU [Candidatus Cloacimonadota bacterium]|nr:phosphate signaling complex protein PhoU [Candidatus Cloacimonadota bacterium]